MVQEEIAVPTGEHKPETTPAPSATPKYKRMTGVGKRIRAYLEEGKDDRTIIETLLPEYLATGRTEKDSRWTILVSLDGIKKELGK